MNCMRYDPEKYKNTVIHVFSKDNLQEIGQFQAPSFLMYHFING